MSTLFGSLSISLQALQAEQECLNTAANNIANVNTDGYSRQRVILTEAAPLDTGTESISQGVTVAGTESIRDRVLELRIAAETQQQQAQDTISTNMDNIQLLFGEGEGTVGYEVQQYFNAVSELSTDASDSTLRTTVMSAAENVATAFNDTATQLTDIQNSLDQSVVNDVSSINDLTSQIADLNAQILRGQNLGEDTGTLEDQRNEQILDLSKLTDVSVTNSSDGLSLSTSNGTALVVGSKSYELGIGVGSDGLSHIYSQDQDLTSVITGGQLGGELNVRDVQLPNITDSLDELAYTFETGINSANAAGYDANGDMGADIFVAPTQVSGAAVGMGLATTDSSAIAASDDGSSGGTGNIDNLLAVQDLTLSNGESVSSAYSKIVYQIGDTAQSAEAESEASSDILDQLNTQRDSVSGVSIDEEAANLIRYQTAYQAAAKVISTINELAQVAVELGSYE